MNYHSILKKVQHYATESFEQTAMGQLSYHNRKHTESVASYTSQLASHYHLDDHDFFIVVAAAWMHDLGYSIDRATHEEKGAEAAGKFLEGLDLPAADIEAVKGCILATKIPQQPDNRMEEIICDADLFHFGTNDFSEANKRMRKEYEEVNHTKINKDLWRNKTIALLSSHRFFTDYARTLLDDQKQRNLEALKEKASLHPDGPTASGMSAVSEPKHTEKEHGKGKNEKPGRGVETMFRVSSSNHQRLSDMADNKAHIMITVNSIILSAVISLLLRKLDQNTYLMIPTFMLLGTSLITMTFSILATRPSIPNGKFSKADIDAKKVNLLFFGNYYRMPLADYQEGMEKMMGDKDYLYGSLIKDGYGLGIVLGKKYHLLRISYNVFMFGLIISVIAFIIASAWYEK